MAFFLFKNKDRVKLPIPLFGVGITLDFYLKYRQLVTGNRAQNEMVSEYKVI